MSSMPTGNRTSAGPPDRYTEAMARVDRCPECVANLEPPYRVELREGCYVAYYGCEAPACGYFWHTSWSDA